MVETWRPDARGHGPEQATKRGPHRTQITIGEHYECDGETPANPDGVLECETERFRIAIGGRVVAVAIRGAAFGTELQYLHGDHLGSPRVITNSTGGVVEERDFTAFGGPLFDFSATTVSSGFTGHRHDAELGLVNMRGRLYDPMVGRFVSPDPFVTDPFSSQGRKRGGLRPKRRTRRWHSRAVELTEGLARVYSGLDGQRQQPTQRAEPSRNQLGTRRERWCGLDPVDRVGATTEPLGAAQ